MTEDKIPFEEKDILKLIDLTFHLAAHKLDYDCGGMIDDLKWFDHTNKDTVNERQTILDQMKEMPEWKKILEDTKKAERPAMAGRSIPTSKDVPIAIRDFPAVWQDSARWRMQNLLARDKEFFTHPIYVYPLARITGPGSFIANECFCFAVWAFMDAHLVSTFPHRLHLIVARKSPASRISKSCPAKSQKQKNCLMRVFI